VDAESSTDQPKRVFQEEKYSVLWGANTNKDTTIGKLGPTAGRVVVGIFGINDDSFTSAIWANKIAAGANLKSFLAFEYRNEPYSKSVIGKTREFLFGLVGALSPQRSTTFAASSQNNPWDDPYKSVYAQKLLIVLARIHQNTGQDPVVVTESMGGMILVKAAILWEGLSALADEEDQDPSSSSLRWIIDPKSQKTKCPLIFLLYGSTLTHRKNPSFSSLGK
jgi:hypothetical protein